jgi:hypothetical protein
MKISPSVQKINTETSGKISENIGKCRKNLKKKNVGKMSDNIVLPLKTEIIAMPEIIS